MTSGTSLTSVNLQMEGLLHLLAKLCDEREVQATVTGSLKGGAIAGAATVLGGLTLGPLGLALGGAVGGGLAAWLSQGQFQPLGQVILAMPRHQQEELTSTIMDAFKRDFSDPAALIQMAMADNAIQGALLTCVVTYLRGQGLQVKGA